MSADDRIRLAEIIPEEHIVPVLKGASKEGVIKELVNTLADAKAIPKSRAKEVTEALLEREKLGSTAIGKGFAVPHIKVPFADAAVGALGRCPEGMDFASLDGGPTYSVFLFLSTVEAPEKHVMLMSRFVEVSRKADFASFLVQTKGRKDLHEFLAEVDEW